MTSANSSARFAHRRNPDGTFDSICRMCFKTVATEWNEAELERHERLHECPGIIRDIQNRDQRRGSRPAFRIQLN